MDRPRRRHHPDPQQRDLLAREPRPLSDLQLKHSAALGHAVNRIQNATDHWVRRLNQLARAMDNRARTRAVTDATREAITRKARSRWKRMAASGPP